MARFLLLQEDEESDSDSKGTSMQPMIHLPLPEIAALDGDLGPSLPAPTTSTESVGRFADLLRAPILVSPTDAGGEPLPPTGNALPLPSGDPGTLPRLAPEPRMPLAAVPDPLPPAMPESAAEAAVGGPASDPLPPAAGEEAAAQVSIEPTVAQPPALVAPLPSERPAAPIPAPGAGASRLEPRVARSPQPGGPAPTPAGLKTSGPVDGAPELPDVARLAVAQDREPVTPATTRTATEPPGVDAEPAAFRRSGAAGEALAGLAGAATSNAAPAPASTPTAPWIAGHASPASPSSGPTATVETGISVPLGDPAWADSLNERVLFLSSQRIQSAEIRLVPAELGPIRVSVAVEDGAANITFSAQHAPTREAIETALPRLREMLSDNGLSLGNANISDHGVSRDDGSWARNGRLSAEHGDEAVAEDSGAPRELEPTRIVRGLVDTYA